MTNAIVASGLRKSYGEIQAVRGIDISIDAGETVALLGPNGAGKSTTIDMILGLAEPDSGTVSVLGGSPSAAIDSGWIGAMLQTGALIRDLSVAELIAMVASLYPEPLGVAETLKLTGLSGDRATAHAEALRWAGTACALRGGARQQPEVARARRADGRNGCRGKALFLDDDA